MQNLTNTQSYNRYRYCTNNPLKYTDPTGYDAYDFNFSGVDLTGGENFNFTNEDYAFTDNSVDVSNYTSNGSYSQQYGDNYSEGNNYTYGGYSEGYSTNYSYGGYSDENYNAALGESVGTYTPPTGSGAQGNGGINWNAVNTGLQVTDGFGVAAAAGREIALDYRMSQPLMNRVGMSSNVKAISGLGTASKYLGAAGYLGAVVGTGLDINAYNNGQLSGARLGYNITGTSVGLGVGYFLGPIAGAAAGGSFYVGQQLYDGYNWWVGQMSIYLTDVENGLRNGWVPGR